MSPAGASRPPQNHFCLETVYEFCGGVMSFELFFHLKGKLSKKGGSARFFGGIQKESHPAPGKMIEQKIEFMCLPQCLEFGCPTI